MSVVRFLEGEGADGAGRRLADVLGMGDGGLEARHDFIQWLFPLPEPSAAVPGSPVLTPDEVAAIRASAAAQAGLAAGAARMAAFYQATDAWLRHFDHNHLRITRTIRSLRLHAGDEAADAFRTAVEARADAEGRVNARSRAYWRAA